MAALIFVETQEAVATLNTLAVGPGIGASRVVALSPWAERALDRAGMAYTRLDEYHDSAELEAVGARSLAAVEAWIDYLDGLLAKDLDSFGCAGLRPAYASFYRLHILHNAVATRLFEVQRVIDAERPDELLYFTTSSRENSGPKRLDFQGESLYAAVIPLQAGAMGVSARSLGETAWYYQAPHQTTSTPLGLLMSTAAKSGQALLRSVPRRASRRDRGTVCALDGSLVNEVVALTGLQTVWWRTATGRAYWLTSARPPERVRSLSAESMHTLRDRLSAFWENLSADDAFVAQFSAANAGFFSVVRSRLAHFISEMTPWAVEAYLAALQRLPRWGVDVVLSQNLAETRVRSVAQAAQRLGIPVAVHDHGSFGYFNFPLDRHTDSAADFRLVWGDGVRDSVARRYPDGASPISVGSVALDRLRSRPRMLQARRSRLCQRLGLDPQRPIVLFAPTLMAANDRYILKLMVTDSELYRHQRVILNVLRDFPGVQCVVKLHPSPLYPPSPIVDWARHMPNCICVTQPALPEAIAIGDLLVTDSPTTTLLQMLLTDKRILVCNNGAMEFEPGAIELLRRRAVFAETADELASELRDHLANDLFDRVVDPDDEFLKAYGTYLNDGRSVIRVTEAVRMIVRTGPSRVPVPL